MANKNVHLSGIQLAVMQALWDEGRATTAAVYERVGKRRSLAYTTVATLLSRLEKRGLVRSNKDGRERTFEPRVSESEVRRFMVSELVGKLFRGDPGALVSHLLKDSEIDEGDRDTVRRMLAKARKEVKNAK
jgi:BlaI family penicillinase repressor